MATWYVAKVSFNQQDEKGNNKPISQSYLFDAVSYTDAETRVTTYVAPENPDFTLVGLTKMKLAEVFFIENGAEIWYKCKVQYIVFDEKAQKEKLVPFIFLINAPTIKVCYTSLEEKLGSVQDYIISDINVTKILDVIPYDAQPEDDKKPEVIPQNMKPLNEVLAKFETATESDSEDIEDMGDAEIETDEDGTEDEMGVESKAPTGHYEAPDEEEDEV